MIEGITMVSSRLVLSRVRLLDMVVGSTMGVSPNVGWCILTGCAVSRCATQ